MNEKLESIKTAELEKAAQFEHTVKVCLAAGCRSAQSEALKTAFENEIKGKGQEKSCRVKGVGCLGLCSAAPLVAVESAKGLEAIYREVKEEDAPEILQAVGKKPVKRLALPLDMPFFNRQVKVALENSGDVDPERIEDYIALDGYAALYHAITEMTPSQVVDEVIRSGLRGRGGGGYPTGLKWVTVAKSEGKMRYVICNGDEGDPGAFMDRSILESDPHRILEGMALAAYAVGASEGYIYVRGEYPLAIKRLEMAIRQATRQGILGTGIMGTTFNFNINIRLGAGAFVCGEETALIASIEGGRGHPRPRPPYPAEMGLWGEPTLINNVETFACVPAIIRKGGEWHAGIGTETSKGTKVFALAGGLVNAGIVEVPMGISLREIVDEIGGGIIGGGQCKAIQTGGPSGGCIPFDHLDTPVDYESLRKLGSIMGSGGMIVMDQNTSMIDVAKFFMEFCVDESCGKCVPCRVGTVQMYNILDDFSKGRATLHQLDLLEKLCDMVSRTSLCGLGQTAPNPVVSTLRYFRDEYMAAIKNQDADADLLPINEAIS
jgi:bidirectional [NiFe] hydrogenase diaphorase subunit